MPVKGKILRDIAPLKFPYVADSCLKCCMDRRNLKNNITGRTPCFYSESSPSCRIWRFHLLQSVNSDQRQGLMISESEYNDGLTRREHVLDRLLEQDRFIINGLLTLLVHAFVRPTPSDRPIHAGARTAL